MNTFNFNADNQQNIIGDNNTVTQNNSGGVADVQKAIEELFESMKTEAPQVEIVEEAPTQDDSPQVMLATEKLREFEIPEFSNNEDHPGQVYRAVNIMEPTATETEQKTLYQRMSSSVKKYATKGTALAALKVVSDGIGALAEVTPPWNVIKAVCESAASLGKET